MTFNWRGHFGQLAPPHAQTVRQAMAGAPNSARAHLAQIIDHSLPPQGAPQGLLGPSPMMGPPPNPMAAPQGAQGGAPVGGISAPTPLPQMGANLGLGGPMPGPQLGPMPPLAALVNQDARSLMRHQPSGRFLDRDGRNRKGDRR